MSQHGCEKFTAAFACGLACLVNSLVDACFTKWQGFSAIGRWQLLAVLEREKLEGGEVSSGKPVTIQGTKLSPELSLVPGALAKGAA